MAAIDPTAAVTPKAQVNGAPAFVGSVLKIIRVPTDDDEDESDEDEDESMDMADLLDEGSGSEDDESEDEDLTGAPSDPSKSPKAKRMAALKEALAQTNGGDADEDEMETDGKLSAKAKGKAKAMQDEDEDESDIDDDEIEAAEEFVLCTLDPTKAYQQTLDITISEYETVYFRTSGTHKVYLTGNILVPVGRNGEDDYDSEDDEGFDLPPDMDEEGYPSEEDESDELDDLDEPRLTELGSDEEDEVMPPRLIKAQKTETGKGKNKRPAPDSSDTEAPAKAKPTADATLAKSLKPAEVDAEPKAEQQMSKSQLKKMRKKMKDNQGNAVETTVTQTNGDDPGEKATVTKTVKEVPSSDKSDKKVQFAKDLVQGPSGSAQPNGDVAKGKTEKKPVNGAAAVTEPKSAGSKGVKTIQGITVDDRKSGSGPAAKKGSKVSMRYIGKLEKDKRVFDSNKKGPPFKFTLGAGDVIQGWDVGLQGISVGGERRLTVPANMAYGSKKMGDIPPNSTLVFDVKCLEVK